MHLTEKWLFHLGRGSKQQTMNIQLIDGQFNAKESLDIISEMIQVKIRFHESKIGDLSNEEDIKVRENKIRTLQNELQEVRQFMLQAHGKLNMHSDISLTLQ